MDRILTRSMDEMIPIEIIYCSNRDVYTKRIILVNAFDDEYVRAYCYKRGMFRTFKRDNILSSQHLTATRLSS